MYTLTKGLAPSKIVASAHSRGPPRHLDSYENRDKNTTVSSKSLSKTEASDEQAAEMSNPRPTFQQQRRTINRRPQPSVSQDSTLQENHQEMVNFLTKQWQKVQESLTKDGENSYEIYKERGEPKRRTDPNYQAFDLERFWENKQLTIIGKSTS
ncbi:hypothetical protein BgiMline_005099 [Biomphalaria glabrata]|uniref:Uncharacterized protein LOC106075637 n=1 Tax=Biomphalaria glabrata TaxID=6526 RepID=A0A2C9KKP3_BIOGL|nr:uncharacterized protein LOC106075637 [Biomphalaria glabrata]KAI8765516.1 KAMAPK regulated corepressor interacting protein 2 [Biomphalaria glabrata]KAI8797496.1 MAPK regulated corepressor interacting protein 2 [Biomphalaria glabrata]